MALTEGGYSEIDLYFEQLTPLVILSTTAEETDKSVEQVEDEVNKSMENPATTEDSEDQTQTDINRPTDGGSERSSGVGETTTIENFQLSNPFINKEYEIYK